MAHDSFTLTGTYQLFDSTPAKGIIEIIPSEKVVKDTTGNIVLSGRVKVTLDTAGTFSVDLPDPRDTTNLNPAGFGYTVVAKLYHQHLAAVSFGGDEITLYAVAGVLDIEDVTGVDPATFSPTTTYVDGATMTSAVQAAVDNLVAGAPGALDTLNELAAAINDDASFAATVTTALAGKADASALADEIARATAAEGTKVNSSTYTAGLAGKQDTATLDAATAANVTSGAQTKAALNAAYARQPDLIGALSAPIYFSHRGGNLLYPEHSMEGYRATAASGFVVEVDVSQLSDGTLVCHHDDTLGRTLENKDGTATSGNIGSITRSQFLNLRIKAKVPGQARAVPVLWEDLLNELGGRAPICVEVKPGVDTEAVWDSIISRGLQKSVLASSALLAQCVEAVDAGLNALLVTDVLGSAGQPTHADVKAAGVDWFSCSTAVSAAQVPIAKAAGLKVIVYTPNTRALVTQQLGYGADGVFTDDPWFIAGVAKERASDPFAEKTPWPHFASTNLAYTAEWKFAETRTLRRLPANTTNYLNALDAHWAGRRGPSVRIRWTAKYHAGAAATTRYAGVAFGKWADEDTTYNHSNIAGQEAYAFGAALNGELDIWRTNGAAPVLLAGSLGSVAGPDIVPDVDNQFEVVITPTDITFKNLTLGTSATATSTDTTIRPVGKLALLANLGVDFKDVWVETL